jgi:virulence-associated protein VapD
MAYPKSEDEWAERAARHLKAELKRADMTYDDLAAKLKKHGFKETKASIANKLARATLSAHFFLASLAALELDGVALEEI